MKKVDIGLVGTNSIGNEQILKIRPQAGACQAASLYIDGAVAGGKNTILFAQGCQSFCRTGQYIVTFAQILAEQLFTGRGADIHAQLAKQHIKAMADLVPGDLAPLQLPPMCPVDLPVALEQFFRGFYPHILQ